MECRTCLAAGVRLKKLDAPFPASSDAQNKKMTYLECLLFCARLKNNENFSDSICIECSRALEISFIFIKNALTANAILLQRAKQSGQGDATLTTRNEQLGGVKFRCKICQEKLDSKRALKDHVKLHMDVITYRCQLCDFDCKKRTHLSDHYSNEHNIIANSTQLKPLMQEFKTVSQEIGVEKIKHEVVVEDEKPHTKSRRLMNLEARNREEEEAQKLLQELEESLSREQQKPIKAAVINEEFETVEDFGFTTVAIDQLAAPIVTEDTGFSNEFVMLADGTVQKVDGTGILIEYIDEEGMNVAADGVTIFDGNDLIVDNTVQIDANCNTDLTNMEFTEVIEEPVVENSNNVMDAANIFVNSARNNELPTTSSDTYNKQNYCKICNQVFGTRSELKIHMLSHSEIPHFFCDRCSFYTFFKNDLTQHYKSKHHVHPSSRQLQPKNKNESKLGLPIYSCDLCFFDTSIRLDLEHHYLGAHKVKANDVQLRPIVDNTDIDIKRKVVDKRNDFKESTKLSNSKPVVCKLCKNNFYTQHEYREHLLWHKQEKKNEALKRLMETNAEDIEKDLSAKRHEKQIIENKTQFETTPTAITATTAITVTTSATNATVVMAVPNTNVETINNILESNAVYVHNPSMHIENNVILPMEAIPQVIGSEQTIAPDGQMDFDFNGDDIFEDFDNVNDNSKEHDDELGHMILTSDDELEDLKKEHNSGDSKIVSHSGKSEVNEQQATDAVAAAATKEQLSAYCVQCNKRFFNQYQFENHMFFHRGLAPYRCELCTNLYNTKRALIKHYKVVHKRMPTRDMIQAKGDKVDVTQFDTASIDLDNTKAGTLMCAKCPFESTELLNLQLHLSNTHGITDQNYVLKKLAFECPRCIRSFETKARLMRHLERNHSDQIILEETFKQINTNINPAIETVSVAQNKLPLRQEQPQQQQQEITSMEIEQQQKHQQDQPAALEVASSTTSGQQQQQDTQLNHRMLEQQQQQEDFNNLNIVGEEYPTSTTEVTTFETIIETTPSTFDEQSIIQDSFVCNICNKNYKSATLLKFHMKRHIERKFRCKFCPKSFVTRSDLDKHTTLHTGDLRYKCDICEKKFGYSHHLKRHRETIHLGRRFFCSTLDCGKVFASKTQLQLHRREHDGTKPFKCPHCQRVFNRREYFRQHAIKAHNIRLSEAEIAEVYRATTGYSNPHDLLVANEGQFVRRSDIEALAAVAAVSNIPTETEPYAIEEEIITEESVDM